MAKNNYDPFDAPIPGQALTGDPGSKTWEQPPRYPKYEDALDTTMERLFEPKNAEKIVTMLEAGIPVEGIARTVVFSGFMEGQYTPDVGFMMAQPVFEAIMTLGDTGGVKNLKLELGNRDSQGMEFKSNMNRLALSNRLSQRTESQLEDIKEIEETKQPMGLMARPEIKIEEEA